MDDIVRQETEKKLEAARKRTLTYCRKCGGTLDREYPHPLGGSLVILQCGACGNEVAMVKKGDYYKNPGNRRRRKL